MLCGAVQCYVVLRFVLLYCIVVIMGTIIEIVSFCVIPVLDFQAHIYLCLVVVLC